MRDVDVSEVNEPIEANEPRPDTVEETPTTRLRAVPNQKSKYHRHKRLGNLTEKPIEKHRLTQKKKAQLPASSSSSQ